MNIAELETPALLIDLDVLEKNLAKVAGYAKSHGLRLRPHTKTHKVPAVGKLQLQSGAVGLTVAKVGEAEVMISSGTPDLLINYPVIGASKLARLAEVAKKTNVTVAIDSPLAARQLSEAAVNAKVTFGALAEVDLGLGRVGVPPSEVVELAKLIDSLPGLKLEGFTFYPGHIKKLSDNGPDPQLAGLGQAVQSILADFRKAGLATNIVSGGSTPTLYRSHEVSGLTEIRPGTYVYNDVNTVLSGACGWGDCAVSIMATVVSTAKKGQMIIDGGSKTFSSDRTSAPPTERMTFGKIIEDPGCVFHNMNEEHGFVDITGATRKFQVGEKVRVIPNHVCVAVNLHEQVYGVRGEKVEQTWKVEGRGKLQ